jgi:ankyrin repeat protein
MSDDFCENVWQQAKRNNFDALKTALANKNEDLHIDFSYGSTQDSFLHMAASRNEIDVVDMLINAGCNLNVTNRHGITPLYQACALNAVDVVEKLMKSGANPNTLISPGLENTTISKDWIDTYIKAPTPLHVASYKGFTDVVEILLGFGELDAAAGNESGDTALHLACHEGRIG